jgi:hypothetical protein
MIQVTPYIPAPSADNKLPGLGARRAGDEPDAVSTKGSDWIALRVKVVKVPVT